MEEKSAGFWRGDLDCKVYYWPLISDCRPIESFRR